MDIFSLVVDRILPSFVLAFVISSLLLSLRSLRLILALIIVDFSVIRCRTVLAIWLSVSSVVLIVLEVHISLTLVIVIELVILSKTLREELWHHQWHVKRHGELSTSWHSTSLLHLDIVHSELLHHSILRETKLS